MVFFSIKMFLNYIDVCVSIINLNMLVSHIIIKLKLRKFFINVFIILFKYILCIDVIILRNDNLMLNIRLIKILFIYFYSNIATNCTTL